MKPGHKLYLLPLPQRAPGRTWNSEAQCLHRRYRYNNVYMRKDLDDFSIYRLMKIFYLPITGTTLSCFICLAFFVLQSLLWISTQYLHKSVNIPAFHSFTSCSTLPDFLKKYYSHLFSDIIYRENFQVLSSIFLTASKLEHSPIWWNSCMLPHVT